MKNIKYISGIVALLLIVILMDSCKKEPLGEADRLFRPIFKTVTEGGNWVKVVWDRYQGTTSYELELSTDSFKTIRKKATTDKTEYTFDNSVIEYDSKYQIRIKGIGNNLESGFYQNLNIKTSDLATMLIAPGFEDILDNAVRVKWGSSGNILYTSLRILKDNVQVLESPLTAADNTAREKIVSGLLPNTSYQVRIYQGSNYMGKKTFKTKSSPEYSGQIIDLRKLSDTEAFLWINQTRLDSIATNFPAGATIILAGGVQYDLQSLAIGANLTLVTGMSFKGRGIVRVNSAFNLTTNSKIQKIKFENIFFTEGTGTGKKKTDANFGGTYLFNIGGDGKGGNAVVDEISITNCDIRYKRGVVRTQALAATTEIKKIGFYNCFVDSIGGYGIINNGLATCKIGDVIVNNSTFAHCLLAFVASSGTLNSLSIDKSTFCYIGDVTSTSVRYIFNFTNQPIPGGLKVSNSVFGASWNNVALHGFRANAGTSVSYTNCYKTSDLVWAPVSATDPTPAYPITDFTDLGKTTNDIFRNPSLNDFKVSDSRLVNKAGDPRWW